MTIHCNVTESDNRALQRHVLFRYRKYHWILGSMLAFVLALTWFGGKPDADIAKRLYSIVAVVMVMGVLTVILMFLRRLIAKLTGAHTSGTVGEHLYEFPDDGLIETNPIGRVETRLAGIRGVDETAHHFFVVTTAGTGHVIPKRDLQNADAIRILQSKVAGRVA